MSELIQKNDDRATIRWKLLTSASALALASYIAAGDVATAADSERPQIWIEAGGQFEQMNDAHERFAPPFVSKINASIFSSPIVAQRPLLSALSLDGKLTFQPEDSDWVFSASMRFGRSGSKKDFHEQTNPESADKIFSLPARNIHATIKVPAVARQFVGSDAQSGEHHKIMDFQAGKDVGLGMLGNSVLSAGVRYAQFTSSASVAIAADPDFAFSYAVYTRFPIPHGPFVGYFKFPHQAWTDYAANENISRNFRGIGPSLTWEASAPFAGNKESAELTFDWGVNAALLFGRQHVQGHHDTRAIHRTAQNIPSRPTTPYPHRYFNPARSKTVTVPNAGGFAGLSFRYPNAKISIGYRADFFFNAIDGGIDITKKENRGFYGPFASISVGFP